VNKLKGILKSAAVKAPGYGDRRKAMLDDIATLTGGKAIFKDLGIELESVSLSDLGRARKVIIGADNTTIVEGGGKRSAVDGRIKQIRKKSRTRRRTTIARNCRSGWRNAGGVAEIRVARDRNRDEREEIAC